VFDQLYLKFSQTFEVFDVVFCFPIVFAHMRCQHTLSFTDCPLDRIIAAVPEDEAGRWLHKRMLANRGQLFVFRTNRNVSATNNISKQHPRLGVILRK